MCIRKNTMRINNTNFCFWKCGTPIVGSLFSRSPSMIYISHQQLGWYYTNTIRWCHHIRLMLQMMPPFLFLSLIVSKVRRGSLHCVPQWSINSLMNEFVAKVEAIEDCEVWNWVWNRAWCWFWKCSGVVTVWILPLHNSIFDVSF